MNQTSGYAAQTLRWLKQELGGDRPSDQSALLTAWANYADQRSRGDMQIVWQVDWPHDFWLACGADCSPTGDLFRYGDLLTRSHSDRYEYEGRAFSERFPL